MGLTAFSFVLLPLCLLLALQPERLLQLVLLSGIFTAAAAATIGSFGVQPNLVPSAMFLGYMTLQLLLGAPFRDSQRVLTLLAPFLIVALYGLASSFALPRLFENDLLVYPQKPDVVGGTMLLAPSGGNLTQDGYLIVSTAVLVAASLYLSRSRVRLDRLVNTYLASGVLAAFLCFWQFLHVVANVPFPTDFLDSNPSWNLLDTQSFGAVPRIIGSFVEPADAASHMVGCVFASGWALFRGHRSRLAWLVFPTTLLATVMTTSTTGFITLACGLGFVVFHSFKSGNRKLGGRTLVALLAALVIAGVAVLTVVTLAPDLVTAASTVADATMSKQDSQSYNDRTTTDLDSLNLGVATFGLGVGWGSNRSSSLVPGIVASLGVVGVAGLGLFIASLWRRRQAAARLAPTEMERLTLDVTSAALLGELIAGCVSTPSITAPDFYVLLALLVGVIVRIERHARQARQEVRQRALWQRHTDQLTAIAGA